MQLTISDYLKLDSWLCEMKEINKGMKRYKIRSK